MLLSEFLGDDSETTGRFRVLRRLGRGAFADVSPRRRHACLATTLRPSAVHPAGRRPRPAAPSGYYLALLEIRRPHRPLPQVFHAKDVETGQHVALKKIFIR